MDNAGLELHVELLPDTLMAGPALEHLLHWLPEAATTMDNAWNEDQGNWMLMEGWH